MCIRGGDAPDRASLVRLKADTTGTIETSVVSGFIAGLRSSRRSALQSDGETWNLLWNVGRSFNTAELNRSG